MIGDGVVSEETVTMAHFGRSVSVGRVINTICRGAKGRDRAWRIVAKIRGKWPWFEKKTRGELLWTETKRIKYGG